MKKLIAFLLLLVSIYSCNTSQSTSDNSDIVPAKISNDTIRIENKELEYEIIIIELGFDSWLASQKPMTYYSNNFLAIKNNIYVIEWNQRVMQPLMYNPNLYELLIDYDPKIDYGIEVNYKLFMYFKFFQKKYNQRL